MRILDGGRQKWIDEGRELTTETPTPVPASYTAKDADEAIRVRRDNVLRVSSTAAVVRWSTFARPQEYSGELMAPPGYEQEGASRTGHIPSAQSIPWAQAVRDDGTFKSLDELRELYGAKGVTPEKEVLAYCRIGERSAHTWFVLRELLGYPDVKQLRRLVDRVGQPGRRPDRALTFKPIDAGVRLVSDTCQSRRRR